MMMGNQYNDSFKGILLHVFPRHEHLLMILIMMPKYTGSLFPCIGDKITVISLKYMSEFSGK